MMVSNRLAASHVWTALKTWKLLCAFKVLTPPACLHGQSLCRSSDHDGFESLGSFSCLAALKTWKLLCAFKVLTPPACLHGQS